jgi:NAD(P)-dependent dehydrogenase (short-subunit alcohol dehydrogenase family)
MATPSGFSKSPSSQGTVLVAGGTGGLGRAVTLAFLEAGYRVISTYYYEEEFAALKTAAGAAVKSLEGHRVNVIDEAEVGKLIESVVSRYSRLDALVNTVGGYAGGIKLWEMDTKILDQMLALNLRSGYALARAAARVMLKQGHGSIVNVGSKAAVDHGAGAAAYAASKAAAVAMMDCLAADLKGTGVRVNSILPSIIDTPTNRKAMPDADFSKWPKPEDIARVIVFIASDAAKLIHGASIPVYGDS